VTEAGLDIAATCRIVELHDFKGPSEWHAVPLFRQCIDAFLMSFKIWNAATVGGNICMSLPAGAMISLTAALEGVCTLWPHDAELRQVPVVDFVTGNHQNVLQKGELLRNIHLPAAALSKRSAMRPGVSHQTRPLGGAHHRHGARRRLGFPADRLGGNPAAGAASLHVLSVV
jgi:CO/xanthine dehydrogenase FAD-binding subunit